MVSICIHIDGTRLHRIVANEITNYLQK